MPELSETKAALPLLLRLGTLVLASRRAEVGREAQNARSMSPLREWYGPNWAGTWRPGGPVPAPLPEASERARTPQTPPPAPSLAPPLEPAPLPLRGDRGGSADAAPSPPSPLLSSAQAAPGGDAALGGRRGPAAAEPSARRSQLSRPRGALTGAGSPPETHLQGLSRCLPCGGQCQRSALARKVSDRRSRRL